MGSHRVPRGETSTYLANGGKQTYPYEGKHRPEKPALHQQGDPKRVTSQNNSDNEAVERNSVSKYDKYK